MNAARSLEEGRAASVRPGCGQDASTRPGRATGSVAAALVSTRISGRAQRGVATSRSITRCSETAGQREKRATSSQNCCTCGPEKTDASSLQQGQPVGAGPCPEKKSHGPKNGAHAKKVGVAPTSAYPPGAVLPKHVMACQWSPFGHHRWFVWTWKRGAPDVQTRVAYSCGSWRCPVCRRHEAAVTFARIREATSRPGYDPDGWVYLCLTIDRNGYYTGRPWYDVTAAYRSLGSMSRRTLKRLRRGWDERLRAWYSVVEAHKRGWPHVNIVAYAPSLARELAISTSERLAAGATAREATLLHGDLLEHAIACGWGRQSTAEKVRDTAALGAYAVKLAGEHDQTIGELAKVTQAPTNAPARFRRLRSAKGFLPPRRRNPEITGALVRRRRSVEGDWEVLRVNPPRDPAQQEPTARAIEQELALIAEEESILSRARVLPALPPMRIAIAGRVETLREATARRSAEAAGGGLDAARLD
jgi:hypothetical protein